MPSAKAGRFKTSLFGFDTQGFMPLIHATDCAECETKEGKIDRVELGIGFAGPLSGEQRSKLLEIAKKCPVHRTLTSETNIRTRAA